MPSEITLGTTDWCPYACDKAPQGNGFIVEFMQDVLKKRGITLKVISYPWARAIEFAKAGKIDGILTAAASEMEGLLPTTTPTGTYDVCFFTQKKNPWKYSDISSLKAIRLGVVADYSYGEPVDSFIKDKANAEKITIKHSASGLVDLLGMVAAGRFDATLDDRNVVANVAAANHIDMTEMKNAGCLGVTPFFSAFNPKLPWGKDVIKFLNNELKKPDIQILYKKYLKKYTKQ